MLMQLLQLPITLLLVVFYALRGILDVLRGRTTLRAEASVLIRAPREDVWRFATAEHVICEGPPRVESIREPLAGSPDLFLTRILVDGREVGCTVSRTPESDEANGIARAQFVPHERSWPVLMENDYRVELKIADAPRGTLLTITYTLNPGRFYDRIQFPIAARQGAARYKRQCEKTAGTQSALTQLADNAAVLALLALASFWYLFGWQDALLVAAIIALHEAGHAAAMRMVGMQVRGIYLIPFFGGAAVPKTAFRTQGHLGFVALMGPGFSLIPALGLVALFLATGEPWLLHAAAMFAIINAVNLLPIYPLDGGQILNAVLGSLSRRLARVAGWIGVLTGLGIAIYLKSLLIGIPFLIFALLRYLGGGSRGAELERLSWAGGGALVLAFLATFALHAGTFVYTVIADETRASPLAARIGLPLRCDLPPNSAEILERFLAGRSSTWAIAQIRILATADRAGHGDIVDRWLSQDRQFAREPRLAVWLRLAKSGTAAEIAAAIAAFPKNWQETDPRLLLTAALLVHGRTFEAGALFPAGDSAEAQWAWIYAGPLASMDSEGIGAALSLFEQIKPHLEPVQRAGYAVHLASRLHGTAASGPPEDRAAVIRLLAEQWDELAKAAQSRPLPACAASRNCKGDDLATLGEYTVDFDVRVTLIEALARLGYGDITLPDDLVARAPGYAALLGAVVGNWADRGETSKIEDFRRRVAEIFAAKRMSRKPVAYGGEDDLEERQWQTEFDFAAATTRIGLLLGRNDAAAATSLANAIGIREFYWQPHIEQIIDHHLAAGDWQQADAWHERNMATISQLPAEGRSLPAENLRERGYHLKRAAASAMRGDMATAGAALARAGEAACALARASVHQRILWFEVLHTAYAITAAAEGRLSTQALAASID